MTINVVPERIAKARAASKTRAEMAEMLGLFDVDNVYHLLKKYDLPLFGKPTEYHSEDKLQRVVEMYLQGVRQIDISKETGVPTASVTGILQRAGVWKKKERKCVWNLNRASERQPTTRPGPIKPPAFNPVPFKPREANVAPLNIPFLDRKPDQCAFLYGDDPAQMTCCGHQAYGTTSWCEAHAQIVFKPAEARNRAPRPR